jgi:hypothetical protein
LAHGIATEYLDICGFAVWIEKPFKPYVYDHHHYHHYYQAHCIQ